MQGLPSLKRDGARVFRAADRPSGLARKPTGLPGRRQLLLVGFERPNRLDLTARAKEMPGELNHDGTKDTTEVQFSSLLSSFPCAFAPWRETNLAEISRQGAKAQRKT